MEHYRYWKKLFQSFSMIYQKIVRKDLSSFSKKCKKPSKSWSFWGGRNGGKQVTTWIFLSWRKYFKSLFLITEKILLLSFKNQEILIFKVKKIFCSNLTVPLWGPPEGTVFHTIFIKHRLSSSIIIDNQV